MLPPPAGRDVFGATTWDTKEVVRTDPADPTAPILYLEVSDPPHGRHPTWTETRRYDRIVQGVKRSNASGRSNADPYAVAQADFNRRSLRKRGDR